MIEFTVFGIPAPQGSKRAFRNPHTGRIAQVESSARLAPWRDSVIEAARAAIGGEDPLDGPLDLHVAFFFPRPAAHYNKRGNLKAQAPLYKPSAPDSSKLLRGLEDALTNAGLWRDDSRVVSIHLVKMFGNPPRAQVKVSRALDDF